MLRRSIITFLSCVLAALPASRALAWGQEGHSIVAELAQHRLSPEAISALDKILGSGVSLASISSWADDWRAAGHNETRRWHFVDVDIDAALPYDPQIDCKQEAQGDCVVAALERFTAVLADPDVAPIDKRPALMFVTHLVGDLHQPLHCSERKQDEGGNLFFVTFDGRKEDRKDAITFHSLWDSVLILERIYSWGTIVSDIEDSVMPSVDAKRLSEGSYADWANDCHVAGIAAYNALNETPYQPHDKDHPLPLNTAYADATVGMMKLQLAKGGIRLAHVLNDAFASSHN